MLDEKKNLFLYNQEEEVNEEIVLVYIRAYVMMTMDTHTRSLIYTICVYST